jgi:uncharacterized OB-fold protein
MPHVVRFVESTITFPYVRSLGPVTGAFMTALTDKRILGIRNGDGVICPPMEWDPATGAELAHDMVEVGPAGTVESWTWVSTPTSQHPLDEPFAFAFIRLDGATTPLLYAVDAGSPDAMSEGMRVAPKWKGERIGHITDIVSFIPGEEPAVDGEDLGPASEPVELMDYLASITYRNPVPPTSDLVVEASREHRLVGFLCPHCGKTYIGGRGVCPIDSLEFSSEHAIDLPHTGTLTNFVVVTPTPYPGQTETEPFGRVFIALDGSDATLGYQPIIDMSVDDIKVGLRMKAVWAPAGEDFEEGGAMGGLYGALIGWTPSGEPDVDDPDLVNRIF